MCHIHACATKTFANIGAQHGADRDKGWPSQCCNNNDAQVGESAVLEDGSKDGQEIILGQHCCNADRDKGSRDNVVPAMLKMVQVLCLKMEARMAKR